MKTINEVTELHYTTGKYSLFAKIVCRDTEHLRMILNDKIQPIKGVERTETFISLEESIKKQIKIE
jgi:Lrp/AsnC family transcriptional regulator for asnA, asnC and gidA